VQVWVGESGELGAVLVQGDQLVAGVVRDVDLAVNRSDCTPEDSARPGRVTVQLPAVAARHVVRVECSTGCDVQMVTVVCQPCTFML